jgi:hypothetical protein
MHLFGLSRRRSETLLLVLGQLILIAYVFQVGAFDHWGGAPLDAAAFSVSGVEGTDAHTRVHGEHCHGTPSGCADAGPGFTQLSPGGTIQLPAPNPTLALETDSSVVELREALLTAIPEPPRTAA